MKRKNRSLNKQPRYVQLVYDYNLRDGLVNVFTMPMSWVSQYSGYDVFIVPRSKAKRIVDLWWDSKEG